MREAKREDSALSAQPGSIWHDVWAACRRRRHALLSAAALALTSVVGRSVLAQDCSSANADEHEELGRVSSLWSDLRIAGNSTRQPFEPTVLSGQDINGTGYATCIANLHPLQPFVLARLTAPADLNDDGVVGGADLGLLLGNWGIPGIGDIDASGTTTGADLGILLGAWGPVSTNWNITWDCSSAEIGSGEIALIQHAAFQLGFDSLDDLAIGMSAMTPSQSTYLAEIIRMTADALAAQGDTP